MDITDKLVIVTGGAGFIGSNLVERLALKNDVIVLDNMHTGSEENLKEAMKTGRVVMIKENAGQIDEIIDRVKEKPDLIFHLGTYSSTPMYKEGLEAHRKVGRVVSDVISIFNYAVKNGNIPVILASSSSVYSGLNQPHHEELDLKVTDFYTEAKIGMERLGEMYSKHYGLPVTSLRQFAVYGKHEEAKKTYANMVTQIIWWLKKGERPVIYGDGTQTRDFTYVEDVVDAYIKAAEKAQGFNIFNVGTGKSYTFNDVIKKLEQQLGRKIDVKYVPVPMKNYVMYTLADTRKTERELGFKARYSLDDGLKKMLEIYGPIK